MKTKPFHFEVYPRPDGTFSFRMVAANGQKLNHSYNSPDNALRTIKLIQEQASQAEIVLLTEEPDNHEADSTSIQPPQ